MYRIFHDIIPGYLSEIFTTTGNSLGRSSRLTREYAFAIPNHRTKAYYNSFYLAVAYLWNSFSRDVVSSSTISIFKRMLRVYLLTLD